MHKPPKASWTTEATNYFNEMYSTVNLSGPTKTECLLEYQKISARWMELVIEKLNEKVQRLSAGQ